MKNVEESTETTRVSKCLPFKQIEMKKSFSDSLPRFFPSCHFSTPVISLFVISHGLSLSLLLSLDGFNNFLPVTLSVEDADCSGLSWLESTLDSMNYGSKASSIREEKDSCFGFTHILHQQLWVELMKRRNIQRWWHKNEINLKKTDSPKAKEMNKCSGFLFWQNSFPHNFMHGSCHFLSSSHFLCHHQT